MFLSKLSAYGHDPELELVYDLSGPMGMAAIHLPFQSKTWIYWLFLTQTMSLDKKEKEAFSAKHANQYGMLQSIFPL